MSVAMPFVKRGVNLANFQSRGTAPCDSEALIMRVRGLAMASAESFSKRGEMLSSPLALPAFSLLTGQYLLLLLRIRSAHLEILGFPMGDAY